ncbi:hypothetical protein NG99_03245 [Erwinia typographi]|uniref:Uncharacterized protein n=1 Tax=Erwinia typographi TaxID=371042 RepID=A0A0A3Z9J7_9GAMM|nr:hypothetical protein [Erwinia typographi]KGT95530.1 hypothetical protein NG99_03245 [Erwinia typographi]
MFRRTRIFIAFAVGFAMICHALTTPDVDTMVRTFFAGMLWFYFCMLVGRMIQNSQPAEDV